MPKVGKVGKGHNKGRKSRIRQSSKRAAYGPREKPAPVTIRRLDDGVVLRVTKQSRIVNGQPPKPKRQRQRPSYSPMLNSAAKEAGYPSYEAYLQSVYWKSIRNQVLLRDQNRCVKCGRQEMLTVHHDRYTTVGQENLDYLKTMCWPCHRNIHA